MKLAIIVGSIRDGRQTHKVAHYLYKLLDEEQEVDPILLDLATFELPMLKNRWEKQNPQPDRLLQFSRQLELAEAIIFVSPEYHGSYTGVLKNAIDHYWQEFKRKPIGVVSTGAGPMGGINASNQMQLLILSIGAYPSPKKLLIPHIAHAFNEANDPKSEKLNAEIQDFLEEFLWFGRALSHARKIADHSTS